MIQDVFAAVRLKLLADSAVNTACGGQIFANKAVEKALPPYLILGLQAGSTDEQTLDRDTDTLVLNVKVVANADENGGEAVATTLASEVRRVLHRCKLTVAGYEFYQMKHRSPFYYTEFTDRKRLAYAGGLYRLELDQVHS